MVKFYAVKVGRQKGVYTSWDDCKHQVQGFSGAIFKGFACMEDAQKFIGSERSERKDCLNDCARQPATRPKQPSIFPRPPSKIDRP